MGLLKSLESRVDKDDWVEQMLTEPAGMVWYPPKIWQFAVRQSYVIPGMVYYIFVLSEPQYSSL